MGVGAVEEAVPDLDEEPAVVRLVHEGLGVVAVVLLVPNRRQFFHKYANSKYKSKPERTC